MASRRGGSTRSGRPASVTRSMCRGTVLRPIRSSSLTPRYVATGPDVGRWWWVPGWAPTRSTSRSMGGAQWRSTCHPPRCAWPANGTRTPRSPTRSPICGPAPGPGRRVRSRRRGVHRAGPRAVCSHHGRRRGAQPDRSGRRAVGGGGRATRRPGPRRTADPGCSTAPRWRRSPGTMSSTAPCRSRPTPPARRPSALGRCAPPPVNVRRSAFRRPAPTAAW